MPLIVAVGSLSKGDRFETISGAKGKVLGRRLGRVRVEIAKRKFERGGRRWVLPSAVCLVDPIAPVFTRSEKK